MLGFMAAKKAGKHYELASYATKRLKKANFHLKGSSEKQCEQSIVANLYASNKLKRNLITQVYDEEVDKITQASLFGFKHRPDTTIGKDGTAIEIKVITSGPSIRDLLGQALTYRMDYRFVILVIIDKTPDLHVVSLCSDKKSREYSLLKGLSEDFNIFTVVGPVGIGNNIVFS